MFVVRKDYTGLVFGKLTVLHRVETEKDERPAWVCECSCGNTTVVRTNHLHNGGTKSCGCLSKAPKKTNRGISDPWLILATRQDARDAFWGMVDIRGEGECWEWQGRKSQRKEQYGAYQIYGKTLRAHRIAYYLANHTIDHTKKLLVMHRCDNPSCVNPSHLRQGTQKENIQDCVGKGRLPWAKLDFSKAQQIRALYATKEYTYKMLGARFGVSIATIRQVVVKRIWPFEYIAHKPSEIPGQPGT